MDDRDSITQLWTRGKFDSEFPQSLADAEKSKRPLSLIMVDIDHFKSVNDRYGHQKGDKVLAGLAGFPTSNSKTVSPIIASFHILTH